MRMKFILSGILIVAIGLVLSHTYRPYVYENHINDYHLAAVSFAYRLRYYASMALITDIR